MEGILLIAIVAIVLLVLCRNGDPNRAPVLRGYKGARHRPHFRDNLPPKASRDQIIATVEKFWAHVTTIKVKGGRIINGLGHGLFIFRDNDNTAHIICGESAQKMIAESYTQDRTGPGGLSPYIVMMTKLRSYEHYNSHAYYHHLYARSGSVSASLLEPLVGINCEFSCCKTT